MNNPPDLDDRVYERFQLLVNAPALFNAIVTAAELDVFRFLSEHPNSNFEDIREFVGIPAHQLRVLLHAVCSTELACKEDGKYSNSAVAERLLASDGPDSWRHILIGWKDIYYPAFSHTTSALRAGTNTALASLPGDEPTLYQRLAHDPRLEAVLHASMRAFTLQCMGGLLDNGDLSSVRHLLDVGGGDGITATQLTQRYPELRVTILDMPSVTKLAESKLTADVGDRVLLQPGDLFDDEFPRGVDAILFSHVLEIFSAEQIRTLLAKAFEVLPSGGRIFLYGFNVSDDERSGVFSARLSLYLNVLATGQGMAYPAKDYESWMREAGCNSIKTFSQLQFEHGLIVGTKE